MEKTFIVTGGTGYLGSTLLQKLVDMDSRVRALKLPSEEVKKELLDKIEFIEGNVCDKSSLEELFNVEGNTSVIHCAGMVSIRSSNSPLVRQVNVEGTKNMLDISKEHGVSKFIYVSSVHAIPEKKNGEMITEVKDFDAKKVTGHYAKTKAEATSYVLNSTLNTSVVHPSGIIGPGNYQSYLSNMIMEYCKGKLRVSINGGYDFVDVRDVVDGIISCEQKGKDKECYILSNRYYSIKEIMDTLSELENIPKVKTVLPLWLAKCVSPFAEGYYLSRKESPIFTPYSMYTLGSNSNFSHQKATEELDYHPRELKLSLKDSIDWLRKNNKM